MFCRKCGTELSENDNFCFKCGTPVEKQDEAENTQTKTVKETPKKVKDEFDELLDLNVEESDDDNVIWEEAPIDDTLILDEFDDFEEVAPVEEVAESNTEETPIKEPVIEPEKEEDTPKSEESDSKQETQVQSDDDLEKLLETNDD
ncbi:MAG: zinc ribbon domain-containing protein, partial [Methanosphaera sp.]|nr:zinc ribbon domain-containing protein [Methanosphaera sp.]